MSFFDNLFVPPEVRNQREIDALKVQVESTPDHTQAIRTMQGRIDQLELMNKALVELLLHKKVVTQSELSVMVQQLDLLDGVEDGKLSTHTHHNAPTCGSCGRYVNPKRATCVYCGASMTAAERAKPRPPIQPTVTCSRCAKTVPESWTYYSSQGVVCEPCFDVMDG
ncbi:MAG: hypothetical protein AAFV53_16450 [Myxococcota bacterium]